MNKLVFSLIIVLYVTGCRYEEERYQEISPNETAFVVKLSDTNETSLMEEQKKFSSIELLEKAKVMSKRIKIPLMVRNYGYMPWSYEYIPAIKVILVDRSPVTREWVKSSTKGTSAKDEAFDVESSNSVSFWVGANCTATVLEEDTALFLYNFAGKSLAHIIDTNIRASVTRVLSREFLSRDLGKCQTERGQISNILVEEIREEYKVKGITVETVALIGGLQYFDKEIQEAINDEYAATKNIEKNQRIQDSQRIANATMVEKAKAEAEAKRQTESVNNQILIDKAKAEAEAARIINESKDALKLQVELEVMRKNADALNTWAEKWQGVLPTQVVPENSNLLLTLPRNK